MEKAEPSHKESGKQSTESKGLGGHPSPYCVWMKVSAGSQEVCTSNLWDFNATFAEELTLRRKQKRTVKEGKKEETNTEAETLKSGQQAQAGDIRTGVEIPTTHIHIIWVWWSAYNPNVWKPRQDLTSWPGRLAKLSGSRGGKKPWSVSKVDSLQERHL